MIGNAVQQAGDYFVRLRSEFSKAKQATEKAKTDNAPNITRLEQLQEDKKEALYRAIDATNEHGDDAVVENLGGHLKLGTSLINTLIACFKVGDFSGKLPKAVLELMSNFTLSKKVAQNASWESVLKRFGDKGDEEIKGYVKNISSRMKKVAQSGSDRSDSPAPKAKAPVKVENSPVKRSRDEEVETRSVKKIAVESSSMLSRKLNAANAKTASASTSRVASNPGSSLLASKARPVPKTAPKPEVRTESPPGTDSDARQIKFEPKKIASVRMELKAPTKVDGAKLAAARSVSAPVTSSALGIASLLESINSKPEPVPVKETPKVPDRNETPEQREKRLRKEARRKLRVKWDDDLVQVRIFHREAEEDQGNADGQGSSDGQSEGMMLKKGLSVEDDDEDDDIPYAPWETPISTDVSGIPSEVREKYFVTRGGAVDFETGEQKFISERENRELAYFYASAADQPPSAKSPPPETATPASAKNATLPKEGSYEDIHKRWKETRQYGSDLSLRYASKRVAAAEPEKKVNAILESLKAGGPLGSLAPAVPAPSQAQAAPTPELTLPHGSAEDQILHLLGTEQARNYKDAAPAPANANLTDPASISALELLQAVSEALRGLGYPPNDPPAWMKNDQQIREWLMGYNKDVAAKAKREAAQRAMEAAQIPAPNPAPTVSPEWAAYYEQQQQQQQYMALLQQVQSSQQQQPPQPPPAATPQLDNTQLQSILAQLGNPQPAAPAPAPAPFLGVNPNDPSYQHLALLQQMQGYAPSGTPQQDDYERERERPRDWEREDEWDRSVKPGTTKKVTLPPHRPVNQALIGTKPCTFWRQGKCARGDKCTFRHD